MAKNDKVNEVAGKTEPTLREGTATDNSSTFEHDLTFSKQSVCDEVHERNFRVVRELAVARGLTPTGAVKVEKVEDVKHENVRVIYAVPVELRGPVAPQVAVSEQPDDTVGDIPEKKAPVKSSRRAADDKE